MVLLFVMGSSELRELEETEGGRVVTARKPEAKKSEYPRTVVWVCMSSLVTVDERGPVGITKK